jgi:O-antigen/teichoic acid export membrane protein
LRYILALFVQADLFVLTRIQKIVLAHKQNIGNLGVLLFVIAAARAIGFMARVEIANVLGKEQFGLFAWGLALAAYASGIIRFGLDCILVRDLVHYPEKTGSFIAASILLRAILMVAVFLLIGIWKRFSGIQSDLDIRIILIIFGVSLLAIDLQSFYDSRKEMWRHALYILVERVLFFVGVFVWVYAAPHHFSLLSIGIILIFSGLVCLGLQYRWAIPKIHFQTTRHDLFDATVMLARQNFWMWLAVMGCANFTILNQLFLKHFCGSAKLGGYAACWQIAAVISLLIAQVGRIGNQATAKITHFDVPIRRRLIFLGKYSLLMVMAVIPFSLPMWFFPEQILRSLFRPEYVSDAPILRIMSVYLVLLSLGTVASQYIISTRLEKTYLCNVLVGAAISVICCLWLIPKYQGWGAATALLVSHGITIGLYWIAVFRHIKRGEQL